MSAGRATTSRIGRIENDKGLKFSKARYLEGDMEANGVLAMDLLAYFVGD